MSEKKREPGFPGQNPAAPTMAAEVSTALRNRLAIWGDRGGDREAVRAIELHNLISAIQAAYEGQIADLLGQIRQLRQERESNDPERVTSAIKRDLERAAERMQATAHDRPNVEGASGPERGGEAAQQAESD